jgi:hypothetical protein
MINNYLKKIELWLSKWKMKMSAAKCNYIIFHNGPTRPKLLELKLFGTNIPFETNPVFLGATFDERLTFNKFFDKISKKCNDRQKVIRILSNRFFKLEEKTLFSVFNALICSVIDFSAFATSQYSRSIQQKFQTIQNSAIRSILYLPYFTSQDILDSMAAPYKIASIELRAFNLNKRYYERNININNPLIMKLINEYKNGFNAREISIETPLCPHHELFNFNLIYG